jgi:glycosyltransferase involved in cell wall biosynthesis
MKTKLANLIDRMDVGGAERVILTFTDVFSRLNANYQVDVVVLENSPIAVNLEAELNLQVLNIAHKDRFTPNNIRKLVKACNSYDVVLVHMRMNFIYVYLFKKLGLIKAKVVLYDHYGKIDIDDSVWYHMDSFLLRPQYFIGVSKTLTQWAVNKLHMRSDRVLLLENIVTRKATPSSKKLLPSALPKVVLVSNIKHVKNQLFAIKLAHELGFHLTLYGQIWEQDYFNELQGFIKQNHLESQVTFVHDCADVQPDLHKFHIGMHCALSETGPLSILEFMAAGLPLLTYNTGQSAKAIAAHTIDFICTTLEVPEWKGKFENLAANYPQYSRLSSELFNTLCNEQDYMQKADAFFKKMLT